MTKSLILLILLLKSCALNSNEKKGNLHDMQKDFFEDINLYALEGVRKIEKSPEYPYIEVQQINDKERNIIYHGSNEMVFHREYKKVNDIWVTSYTTNGDTCSIITFEYITSNKVVDLYYCYNIHINDTILTDVTIFEGSTETTYDMENVQNITPSMSVVDLAKARNKSIFTREIIIKSNHLVMKEQQRSNTNQMLSEEIKCYASNNHSYFWWRYFGWSIKKIDCE